MRNPFGGAPPPRPAPTRPKTSAEVEEEEERRRGERGFGAMVDQLIVDQEKTPAVVAREIGATVEELQKVIESRARCTAEFVRLLSVSLDHSFSDLFDVWDVEAPTRAERMMVAEARDMIRRKLKRGTQCPCCGQVAKYQTRSWQPLMISFLRWLVANYRGEPLLATIWCDAYNTRGGDYGKISRWNLAVRKPGRAPLWSPTQKGVKFVRGQIKVPIWCREWRGEILAWAKEHEDIDEICQRLKVESPQIPQRTGKPVPPLPGF